MATKPATIIKKSSTSTEVIRAPVRGILNGLTINPTGNVVKAAYLAYDPPDTTGKRAPLPGDYVTTGVSWETAVDDSGAARYWADVLMGPGFGGALNPAGPAAADSENLYQLWIEIDSGSETIRKLSGLFAVTP